jgi:hypothetical protein
MRGPDWDVATAGQPRHAFFNIRLGTGRIGHIAVSRILVVISIFL